MNPENTYNDARPLVIGMAANSHAEIVSVAQGVLAPGTVLGRVTVSGELLVCGVGNGDGSEEAMFVLTKEIDTTLAAVTTDVLKTGWVNGAKLIFAGVETLADVVAATGKTHDDNLKRNGIVTVIGDDLEAYDNT